MTGVEIAMYACGTFHGFGMLYLLGREIGWQTLVSGLLVIGVTATGVYLDRKEATAAAAFMAKCKKSHTHHDCLLLWGGDTDVFEGEPM